MQNVKETHELDALIAEQQWDKITEEDWEAMLVAFSERRAWEEMWQLVQKAPVWWSVQVLLRVRETGWTPEPDAERAVFTTLVHLAEKCRKAGIENVGGILPGYAKLRRHPDWINDLAISPDGRLAASGYSTGVVQLWSLPDGKRMHTLTRHPDRVTCLAISLDGQMLVSGDTRGTIRLWNLPDGVLRHTLRGHKSTITCFAFSSDGQVLASGSQDKTVRFWRLPGGAPLHTLRGHSDLVLHIAISHDGRLLASGGSSSSNVWVWRLPEGDLLHKLGGHADEISCLAISPDGRVLTGVSGTWEYIVQVWNLADGTLARALKLDTLWLPHLAISLDGRTLATWDLDALQLRRLPDGTVLYTLKGYRRYVQSLAISADKRLLAGVEENSVRLWSLVLIDLPHVMIAKTRLEDLKLVKDVFRKEDLPAVKRVWLEFVLVLMRRHLSVQARHTLNILKQAVPATAPGDEQVALLLQACQDTDDAEIALSVCEYLVSLNYPEAIDILCARWMNTRESLLEQAISQKKFVARRPPEVRVFSALKAGKPDLLKKSGVRSVEPLVRASEDTDPDIAARARQVLFELRQPKAKEALCQIVIDHDQPVALEAALALGYLPQDVSQRALFLFMTGQWKRYEALDFDHELLGAIYRTASPELRLRISSKIRKTGRTDFLTVLAGADYRSRAAEMTPAETDVLVHLLSDRQEWAKLWRLVFELPFPWSSRIMTILRDKSWQPEQDDDQRLFQELRELVTDELVISEEEVRKILPLVLQEATLRVHGRVNDVAFSPVRPVLAIGTSARKVALWNFQQGEVERVLKGFKHSIGLVRFLPDGSLLCAERTNVRGESCAIYACHGEQCVRIGQHEGSITGLEAVGHSQILSTGRDYQMRLWDVKTGGQLKEESLGFWARAVRVSPDGRHVVLLHKKVTLMNISQLEKLARGPGSGRVGRCVEFLPSGNSFVIGKLRGDVLVYKYSGKNTLTIQKTLTPHREQVEGIAVLPFSSTIITVGAEGKMQFTTWTDWSSPGSIKLSDRRFTSLHVSPDRAFMATGHADASISLWDLRVLNVPMLFSCPFAHASKTHLAAVKELVTHLKLDARVRQSLLFMQQVLQHRFRFDIEIEEAPTIKVGEFDIEIG